MCKSTKYQIFSGFSFAPLSFARLTCAHRQTAAHFTSNLFRALSFTRTPSRSTRSYCSCLCVRFSLHCCCYCCFYCTFRSTPCSEPTARTARTTWSLCTAATKASELLPPLHSRSFVCLLVYAFVCVCVLGCVSAKLIYCYKYLLVSFLSTFSFHKTRLAALDFRHVCFGIHSAAASRRAVCHVCFLAARPRPFAASLYPFVRSFVSFALYPVSVAYFST